ncbi:DEAD/DEAH box helicase [Elizabethkingia phage TCUEAP1]|nr:DEAD/DEAH box helicase [Elizabethkingia phage TCUEAP1]
MLKESNLHGYQRETINHIVNNEASGVFLDMGLGKTVSSLTAVNYLKYTFGEINKTLIIAPKRVAENVWTSETENWEHLKHLKIIRIRGNEKQRIKAIKEDADIYTISRDLVVWLCAYFNSSLPYDMVIIDESSSFKNPSSNKFKALKVAIVSVPRVVLLTGTPTPNSLIDIWSQMYLLDRGERLGKTVTQFKKTFFTEGRSKGHIVYDYRIKDQAEHVIHHLIGDICISMKAKDYLSLPPRIDNYIKIQMPPDILKKYKDFERDQILTLEYNDGTGEIIANSAAAVSNKLLQFNGGAVFDADRNVNVIHSLKLEALEEIVEANEGKPILVAYAFTHERDRILEHFKKKIKVVQLAGEDTINDWNAGKIDMLIMHPASGGHGLNIQKGGNIMVWYGMNWSLELYQQFRARLDRQGQTAEKVFNHHLIIEGSIDEDVVKSLDRKDGEQEGLLTAIKRIAAGHK